MKNWQKFAAAASIAAMALAGCGGSDGAAEDGKGSVYYLNFKPEQDQAWQKLAEEYTKETGVDVKVVTAASGNYETTLQSEMGKSSAPTLFQVNGYVGLNSWKDYAYNLYDTDVYKQLISDQYALFDGKDNVPAIAYCIESFGIIVNTNLLEKAGYTTDDIKSFEDLKKVAEDITARADELGFSAFTSAGMDGSSDWRFKTHLANQPLYFEYVDEGIDPLVGADEIKGSYLDNYRQIFDLYINNSTAKGNELAAKTGDDSRNEFTGEQAVFYQNGTWEFANLTDAGMDANSLKMIPIYVGAGNESKQGLSTGTENYWVVNKDASEADIQATLDFMNWCVTSDAGTTAMADEMGFSIPFKDAKPSPNVFLAEAEEMTKNGMEPVAWSFTTMPSEEYKNMVGSALTAYAADPTDENWAKVEDAFVNGWKTEKELTK